MYVDDQVKTICMHVHIYRNILSNNAKHYRQNIKRFTSWKMGAAT